MTVLHLVHRQFARIGRQGSVSAGTIRPYVAAVDDPAVAALLAADADPAAGPRVRPAGLLAELRGRPGRSVTAWLASGPPAAGGGAADAALGLVTLVESRGREAAGRWSIGWLVVHPSARRQGVGRALVATAVGHARAAGATVVHAETSADWPAAAFWQAVGFEAAGPDD